MASVNKVTILGNVGKDPEIKTFPSGDQMANVAIATSRKWRDKNSGENKEETEWHRVVFNGRLAEIVGEYIKKGSSVYVEGSLRTRKWTDQKTGQERYATEIRADSMQMLGGKPEGQQGQQQSPARQQGNSYQNARNSAQHKQSAASGFDDMDSDIPF